MSAHRAVRPAQHATGGGWGWRVGLLGALALISVAVVGGSLAGGDEPGPLPTAAVAATPAPTVTATATTTVTADASSDGTSDRVELAQGTKPLRDLVPGDRVLYVAEPGGAGAVCEWVAWGGEIAVSSIRCGSETFDTPTGYLTPVETR